MEVVSDSSSESVIISGPIPDYPELKRRKPNPNPRCRRRKDDDDHVDNSLDDKVEKIQELEDLVNASASIPIGSDHLGNGDPGNWSGSDTKSLKGGKSRNLAGKYLKKIKTLQQNKRRQETRISRLTKEVRSLRDKNSVQAAYIDVLCGMLGEDMKEKFRDRQGLGILGNVKAEDEEQTGGEDRHEDVVAWCAGEGGARNYREESEMKAKEKEFYCVEELDNLPSTSSGVALIENMEELPIVAASDGRLEENDENGDPNDGEVFHATDPLENGEESSTKNEEIGEAEQGKDEMVVKGEEDGGLTDEQGTAAGEPLDFESAPENQMATVDCEDTGEQFKHAEVACDGFKDPQVTHDEYHSDVQVAGDEYRDPIVACQEYEAVPLPEDGRHLYDQVPDTKTPAEEFEETSENGHPQGVPDYEVAQRVPEYVVADSQSSLFQYDTSGNLPVPENLPDHLNLQELLENGNHFLSFKDTTETESSLIQGEPSICVGT
ncbi:hypothetical protein GE061_015526 [Apolygus lucorum]|uniref:Uncharacterized protein n=1 Tax=Apolygus lucorum TaxID=248454 RepID=A0A6A4J1F3_APOLU|nr:hypothetical protein GE061_015526 [Apolygus lucorum]